MTVKRELSQVEVIALDFYDGATEGFALSLEGVGASYFKLIAWDDSQDQRLFVTVPISESIFKRVLNLLSGDSQPASKVWLANWVFKNPQEESEANKIVESCQSDLKSKGVLILGNQIGGKPLGMFNIDNSLISSVEKALQEPENLDCWLAKLEN